MKHNLKLFSIILSASFLISGLAGVAAECPHIAGKWIGGCKVLKDPLHRFPDSVEDLKDLRLQIEQFACTDITINGQENRVGYFEVSSRSKVFHNETIANGHSQSTRLLVNQGDQFVKFQSTMASTKDNEKDSATVTSERHSFSKLNETTLIQKTVVTSGFSEIGASVVECKFEKTAE